VNQKIIRHIASLRDRGALFVVNHSGGKDSQVMLIVLRQLVPDEQLLLIHADLGEVEWEGNVEHIRATAGNLPLIVCRSRRGLLQMVRERRMWPSPKNRQCTSDLKRGPIEREVRRYLKANPQFHGLVVNCMGIRAEESSSRAKAMPFKLNEKNSKAGREWYDMLPVHDMLLPDVWETIRMAGQEPHPVYAQGMTRLSCRFCIMASQHDLRTAALLSPDLYRTYVQLEKEIEHTMNMEGRGLEDVTGIMAAA
jgi:DNA sulfur modification protein DndC